MACWTGAPQGTEAVLHASEVEVRRIRNPRRLGAFLGFPQLLDVRLRFGTPPEGPSQLLDLLDEKRPEPPTLSFPGLERRARTTETQSRNSPCACGSGQKYKRCHGR